MPGPKVLFYVQHLLGIGHLARASRVASALKADGFEVTIVTGGRPVPGFPSAEVDHVALPSVRSRSESFSGLVDDDGNPIDDAFRARRTDLLLQTLRKSRPDIVILEAFPFGRRQMRFELLPLLDAIRDLSPRPRLVTSIRDLLQEKVKPGRNEETLALLNDHFDLVMVHGDPSFARLEDTFPLASEIRPRVGYTGLVAGQPPTPAGEAFPVLISAGGGAAGTRLVSATVEAAQLLPENVPWGLITGPNLPQEAFDRAAAEAPPHLKVMRFREDFPNLLASAELSVSQAGYNTVGDLLGAGCRSLLIPFSAGGETEQTARAERLAQLGLASMIAEDDLTPERLAGAIERALAQPKPPSARLDLDGARGSARLLRTLF
ncbi:glycosyl transferase [Pseudaminobacter sp. 19-2017]|uniref:Glycosyl transferase n=2 Tax=Pseudaminobacter soli (ex Zhang et al. 2022) TaxID=2831468 RepID=A0A942DY62_9HYPH|nr:glycosyl transferase [Pseudaminobacter soli]